MIGIWDLKLLLHAVQSRKENFSQDNNVSYFCPEYPRKTQCVTCTTGSKSVETLGSKLRCFSIWKHFPQTMLIFPFLRLHADHSVYIIHNIEFGAGDIRESTLDEIKIEYEVKYQKVPFSKSVSITFFAHFSFTYNNRCNTDIKVNKQTFICDHDHSIPSLYLEKAKINFLCSFMYM